MSIKMDLVRMPQVYLLGKTYLSNNDKFYIRNDSIVQMAVGDRHSIILTGSGRAYAFGDNKSGQLGLGHRNPVKKISCIKSLKFDQIREKLILVACGGESSLFATDVGSLYAFGLNNHCQLGMKSTEPNAIHSSPIKLEPFRWKISWKQLAMGAEHTCALTNDGEVYIWGSNELGQCGLQSTMIRSPRKLKLEYSVNAISCGYYHTALVSDKGRLFLFGDNSNHQLGRTIPEQCKGPMEVSLPDPVRVVACGIRHTVVLTEKGDVYTSGRGDRGQLGLGRKISFAPHFQKIENLPNPLTTIAAGRTHTAIIDSYGLIYLFGDGKHAKLNYQTSSNKFQPHLLEQFEGYHVLQVVCGGCQTIILARRKPSNTNRNLSSQSESTLNLNVTSDNKCQSPTGTISHGVLLSFDQILDISNERKADYTNRFQKNFIFDDESLFSDEQSMVISEESIEETASFYQNNYSTTSSTTSGRTSSSISSLQVDDFIETIESADTLEHSSPSETATHAKAYLINSTGTPSNPGFFSRILNRKLSINTPRNSRTCSMM